MVKVEKGGTYRAAIARSGVSSRGDWELVQVRDKGTKSITIWPENKPTGIEQGDEFVVKEITEVKLGARQVNGVWKDDFSVGAILEKTQTVNDYDFDIDSFANPDADDSPFKSTNFVEIGNDETGLPY